MPDDELTTRYLAWRDEAATTGARMVMCAAMVIGPNLIGPDVRSAVLFCLSLLIVLVIGLAWGTGRWISENGDPGV